MKTNQNSNGNMNGLGPGRKPGINKHELRRLKMRAWQLKQLGYSDGKIAWEMGRSVRTIRRWLKDYYEMEYKKMQELAVRNFKIYNYRFWNAQIRVDELDDEIEALRVARAEGETVDESRLEALTAQRKRAIAEADRWKRPVEKNMEITTRAVAQKHAMETEFEIPPQLEYDVESKYAAIRAYRRDNPLKEGEVEDVNKTALKIKEEIDAWTDEHAEIIEPSESL